MSRDLRQKLLLSLVLALLVYIGLAFFSDWRQLTTALTAFPWPWLAAAIGLTLVNYLGRALRWYWYMRLLDVPIGLGDATRVFGVGMLMVMTPGKAGEFLKSYMIKKVTGTPISVTAPVILAERLLDGVAMLGLAAAGLFAFPNAVARGVAALVLIVFIAFVVVVQTRPLALWCLGLGEWLPVASRFVRHLHRAYESAYLIFNWRNLTASMLVGALCWAAEGVAYYVVLVGFGVTPSPQALLIAVFIFNISTVIGAVVAMPGGLGGVEGSLVALSVQLLGLATPQATAAALLVRFCTLWFGVLLGVASFARWPHLLAGAEREDFTPNRPDATGKTI